MKNILIDAGPLIALFDKSDQYHQSAVSFLKTFEGLLFTTWPVITEVSHMLDFSTKAQTDLLEWMSRGGLQLFPLDESSAYRLMALTKKFDDVPMDLADASLIIASEELNILEIASIDSDFYVYRTIRNDYLTNIFPLMKNA